MLHHYGAYRGFRFGVRDGSLEKGTNLYTINIPVQRSSKPDPCFLAQWDGETFKPRLIMNAGTEVLSAMTVRLASFFLVIANIKYGMSLFSVDNILFLYWKKRLFF